MKIIYRILPFAAVSIAVACATSPNTGGSFTPPPNASGGSINIGSGSSNGVFFSDASFGGDGFGTQVGGDMDSGISLAADGAVNGTCVVGRTCDPSCDELVENGQHEYIEPTPDDGSPLPPANVSTMFSGSPSTSGGPCIIEPPDGSLFPNNWLRPRVYFVAGSPSQTIYQIKIHAARQSHDLVVYTESRTWEIPKDIWKALGASTWGEDITVTVSAVAPGGGTPSSSQVHFQIAPAKANGSMVYWAAVGDKNGLSWLEGFGVGDEGASKLLTTAQVQSRLSRDQGGGLTMRDPDNNTAVTPGSDLCIGCHVAAPDQQSVAFLDFYPWPGVAARVDPMNAGGVPTWLTPAGGEALSQPWLGMLTFSADVWNSGAHRVVSTYAIGPGGSPWMGPSYSGPPNSGKVSPRLVWIDLSSTAAPALNAMGMTTPDPHATPAEEAALVANAGTSYGFIATTGDTRGAESPSWSHNGQRIVYASTDMGKDGRLAGQVGNAQMGSSDLYAVDYNGGAGGAATPVQGAAEMAWDEFYPAFSPDDKYIAFDRVPNADGIRYYAPKAEVFVVDAKGGAAKRIKANDPPACMTQVNTNMPAVSPGVTNSWARWSPEFPTCSGKTYYWLIFSSSRLGRPFDARNFKQGLSYPNEPTSQLYLTSLIDDGSGNLTDSPGVYIWNQPISNATYPGASATGSNQSNHTPSWEVVEIPPPAKMPPPPPPR